MLPMEPNKEWICVEFNTAAEKKNYKFIYLLSLRIVQPLAKR
jgi:hypothetical protein